jgi:tetratricopeptide (TPR) repeat protein
MLTYRKYTTKNMIEGKRLIEEGDYQSAIKIFTKCVNSGEGGYYAYFERGLAKHCMGQHSKALKDMNHIIENRDAIDNKYLMGITHYNMGDIYFNWRMFEEALEELDKGIKYLPQNLFCYYLKANVELELKYYKQALKDINRAIKMREDFGLFHIIKGRILSEMQGDEKIFYRYMLIAKTLIDDEMEDRLYDNINETIDERYLPDVQTEQFN